MLNEEESLPELTKQILMGIQTAAIENYEIIFIDDGSSDNSFKILKELKEENKRIHCIRFRRNYGKSAALAAGFQKAKGKYVITMDADLQDDPNEIPNLLNKLKEGYDLVSGWKKKRYDPISKTIPSKLFNYTTSLMSGVRLHDFNCGLKGYRSEVVKNLQVYGEMHRYLPALAHFDGFKVTEIPVQHHPRKYGITKFGLSRFVYGFLDLLTVLVTAKYMKRPLHFFGAIGTIFTLLGFITNVVLTLQWFMGEKNLSNRPLLQLGIALIIVGIQFISLGLLGELLVKHHMQNNKNIYSISESF
ncbi:MAG: glycosyl transferase family 2 [Ignavibacteria bacterium GWF2_33_9]|nr:MAG: glycosyl transferase family 2 [Ignavibacteria bacterium GWF2_33_9]